MYLINMSMKAIYLSHNILEAETKRKYRCIFFGKVKFMDDSNQHMHN